MLKHALQPNNDGARVDPLADLPSFTASIGYIVRPDNDRVIVDYSGKGRSNNVVQSHDMPMVDLRPVRNEIRLESHGFELVDHRHPMSEMIHSNPDFDDAALFKCAADYHADIIPLIRSRTGARDIVPLKNGVTMRRHKVVAEGEADWKSHQSVRLTSPNAHIDITARSAHNYVWIAMAWEGIQEIAPYSRFAILQTWHVLTPPPQDYPLTFCDPHTVSRQELFTIDYFPPQTRIDIMAESHALAYSPEHRWVYFSNMTPDELILFKGYDSDPEAGMLVPPHTAFRDPRLRDGVTPRASIESRYLLFFQ